MARLFPESSFDLLLRFAANSPKTAINDYTAHLTWRETNPLMTDHSIVFHPSDPIDFPKKWMEKGGIAKDGSYVLFVQGAMYDKSIAPVEKYIERLVCVACFFCPSTFELTHFLSHQNPQRR